MDNINNFDILKKLNIYSKKGISMNLHFFVTSSLSLFCENMYLSKCGKKMEIQK